MDRNYRLLGKITLLTAALSAVLSAAVLLGAFDPPAFDRIVWSQADFYLSISPDRAGVQWLDSALPAGPFELSLTAAYAGGEQDIGYGLFLDCESESFAVSVSPLGYVTLWTAVNDQMPPPDGSRTMPWQTWPHIGTDFEANEILIHRELEKITVRLNGELFWSGQPPCDWLRAGVWSESFGGSSVIRVSRVALLEEQPKAGN